jgi:uncharacterized membrane protein
MISYCIIGAILTLIVFNAGGNGLTAVLFGTLLGAVFAKMDALKARIAQLESQLQSAVFGGKSTPEARSPDPAESSVPQTPNTLTPQWDVRTRSLKVPEAYGAPVAMPKHFPDALAAPSQIADDAIGQAQAEEKTTATPNRAQFQAKEPTPVVPIPPPLPSAHNAAPGWGDVPANPTAVSPKTVPTRPVPPSYAQAPPTELPEWAKTLLSFENWPIKLGMALLLIGLASGYRYLAARGYFNVPIELRLLAVALVAIAALVFGYGKRESKRSFALSVQGAALGALLLTVYASLQLYHVLNGPTAFALMLAIVATGVVLAVLQDALWLALFATIGGFAAPILASTGGGSHVQLFGYYLILNLGILAISLQKGWRSLNILGAVCTFGIGLSWGVSYYRPEFFGSVEPFLIAFFAIYLAITVLYTLRHGAGEAILDGVLVFGVPLATLSAQAGLLAGQDKKLAASTFIGALIYAGLGYGLKPRPQAELLHKCFLVLAVVLFTISIPLYFNAQVTSALWALEGAGVLWLGLRQGRIASIVLGLALQLLAWFAYFDGYSAMTSVPALLNAKCLGALILCIASIACGVLLERAKSLAPNAEASAANSNAFAPMAWLAVVAGLFWWTFASLTEIARFNWHPYEYAAVVAWLGISILLWSIARMVLRFDKLSIGALLPIAFLPLLSGLSRIFDDMFADRRGLAFGVFIAASIIGFFLLAKPVQDSADDVAGVEPRRWPRPLLKFVHSIWLIGVCLLVALGLDQHAQNYGDGMRFALLLAPFALAFFLMLRELDLIALPLQKHFGDIDFGWRTALMQLWSVGLFIAFVLGSLLRGDSDPMAYLPLINPLELSLLAIFGMLLFYGRGEHGAISENSKYLLLAMAFWLLTTSTLRGVIQLYDPSLSSLAHAFFNRTGQAALALMWSFAGCGAMLLGHARARRPVWLAGAALMGVVLVKMFLVDRHNLGELPGIFATLGVGALLAAVGYFAPVPPAQDADGAA